MAPILEDDRLDPGQFGDLMDQRLGVVASEPMTTAATGRRLAIERLADLLGWYQDALGLAMPGLAAALLPARRGRGFRFTPIGSDEGGLDELVELSLSRASRSRSRAPSSSTRCRIATKAAAMAACASGGTLAQSSSGMGSGSIMKTV
jgi:hypothetical protein